MDTVEIEKLKKKVGKLGLGAAPFGGVYGETKITDCGMTLRTAIDNGVRYIDTAPWYGQGWSITRHNYLRAARKHQKK